MPRLSNVASCGQLSLHSQSNSLSMRPRSAFRGLQREGYVHHFRRKCSVAAWEFEVCRDMEPVRISLGKKLAHPAGREKLTVTDLLEVEGTAAAGGEGAPPAGAEPGDGIGGARKHAAVAPIPPLPGAIATDDCAEDANQEELPPRREHGSARKPPSPPAAAGHEGGAQPAAVRKAARRRWSPKRAVAAAAAGLFSCGRGGGHLSAVGAPLLVAECGSARKAAAGAATCEVEAERGGSRRPSSMELAEKVLSMSRSASEPALVQSVGDVAYFSDHTRRGGKARKKPRPLTTA